MAAFGLSCRRKACDKTVGHVLMNEPAGQEASCTRKSVYRVG